MTDGSRRLFYKLKAVHCFKQVVEAPGCLLADNRQRQEEAKPFKNTGESLLVRQAGNLTERWYSAPPLSVISFKLKSTHFRRSTGLWVAVVKSPELTKIIWCMVLLKKALSVFFRSDPPTRLVSQGAGLRKISCDRLRCAHRTEFMQNPFLLLSSEAGLTDRLNQVLDRTV